MARLSLALAFGAAAAAAASPLNVCGSNSTLGAAVIGAINLTYPGLDAVASAAAAGDLNEACEALATYYRTSNTSWWLRLPAVAPSSRLAGGYADAIAFNDTFFLSGVGYSARVPRNPDGGLDWLDYGPYNDKEFMNCLNRFDSFVELLGAWQETGNPVYPTYFNNELIDWVTHLPCPNALSGGSQCVPAGLPGTPCSWADPRPQACATGTMESPWRSLEMGIRMSGQWPQAFFGFQAADEFSTSARVLMVLGVAQHNAALVVDGGHPGNGTPNWEMTQWQGLVSSSVSFPELLNASNHLALAFTYLEQLLDAQVYPDGVETEMASGYDIATANDFLSSLQLLAYAGMDPPSTSYVAKVRTMWQWGAFVADQRGCLPNHGDSDICVTGYSAGVAAYFNASDWTYFNSNGRQGSPPPWLATEGPSFVFPWAGQVAMRSGLGIQDTWVWFDVGPHGSSIHGHRDKLGLQMHARNSLLLVDSGHFAYSGTDLSATLHVEYARNTSAHNTLTIDDCDQQPLPAVVTAPISNSSYSLSPGADWAYGSMSLYNGIEGEATHTRGVYFYRPQAPASGTSSSAADASTASSPPASNASAGAAAADGDATGVAGVDGDFLVVVDRIVSNRPRTVQAAWHTHPNASGVAVTPDPTTGVLIGVTSGVDLGSGQPTSAQVCIIPAPANTAAGGVTWDSAVIQRGVYANATTGAVWAGWYSATYDDAWPASAFTYRAEGIAGSAAGGVAHFVWLLLPTSQRSACDASVALVGVDGQTGVATVSVTLAGAAPQTVVVQLGKA